MALKDECLSPANLGQSTTAALGKAILSGFVSKCYRSINLNAIH